jgi:Protein of unknown function (DUF3618)
MAPADPRTPEEVRRDLETERRELAAAVDSLRGEMSVTPKLRARLPAVTAGALGAGFVLGGGIGATMRLLFRRGRER